MNVQENVEAILRRVTEEGAFGEPLLFLIKQVNVTFQKLIFL